MRLIEYGGSLEDVSGRRVETFSNLLNPEWHFVFWREKFERRDYAELFSLKNFLEPAMFCHLAVLI